MDCHETKVEFKINWSHYNYREGLFSVLFCFIFSNVQNQPARQFFVASNKMILSRKYISKKKEAFYFNEKVKYFGMN